MDILTQGYGLSDFSSIMLQGYSFADFIFVINLPANVPLTLINTANMTQQPTSILNMTTIVNG